MKAKTERVNYSDLPAAELDRLAAECDREWDLDELRPLTAEEWVEENRARNKLPGRPPVGEGAEKLRISMERSLLKRADAYAKRHKMTRSQLIAEGLRRVLGAA